ncbi:MAG: NAD(P)H-dependent oxidoreductase [Thermoplasmata archaeon]|nr:NAD(P)H-dependent oxidoreductase [Thermoplasmata archaeon]
MGLYLPVLYGTVREGRRSITLARYVEQRLAQRPGVRTRFFDAAELPFGNLVRREWEIENPPQEVTDFVREMGEADGFVIVTPEYNYSIPGALKNVIDHLFDEWHRKPFGIVTAGGIGGGLRAADTLRQVIPGVRGVTVPSHVPVRDYAKAFNADGTPVDAVDLDRRLDILFADLEWYAKALQLARKESADANS